MHHPLRDLRHVWILPTVALAAITLAGLAGIVLP